MSSDDIAISVRNLGKTYRLFGHPGDRIKQFLSLGIKKYHNEFTALHDVSFDIKKGETVGIIGRNGSGKSTLLQLICGILKPTTGTVKVNGRISALLELGAGFNPEFTGRENVYFQGAVMGVPKDEMDTRFDEIAAFADIGEFIDQPVRVYSSGMFVRLAFSVAVHAKPDILLVDEALAVGDQAFQRKCVDHMEKLRREQGVTILFVSHSIRQIERFCSMALLFDRGGLVFIGEANAGCNRYYQMIENAEGKKESVDIQRFSPDVSDSRVRVDSVSVGVQGTSNMHEPLVIHITLSLLEEIEGLEIIVGVHTQDVIYVTLSSSAQAGLVQVMPKGAYRVSCLLKDNPLRPDSYWVGLGIYDHLGRGLWRSDRVHPFNVSAGRVDLTRLPTNGILDLPFTWEIASACVTQLDPAP